MKHMYLTTAIFTFVILAGCSNDDYSGPDRPGIKAEIWGTINNIGTRASGTSWGATDCIGVSVASDEVNIKYQYSGNDSKPFRTVEEGSDIFLKGTEDSQTLTAYYPYTGTNGTAPGIINVSTVSENQTTTKQPEIDFLFATATGSRENPVVNFAFTHKMSKLDFNFKKENPEEIITDGEIQFSLNGLLLNGTFDTATGKTSTGSNTGAINQTITNGTTSLILLPQTRKNLLLEVEYNNKYFVATVSTMELIGEKVHTYTITINDLAEIPSLTISSGSITDWEQGTGGTIATEEDKQEIKPSTNPSIWGDSGKGEDISSY